MFVAKVGEKDLFPQTFPTFLGTQDLIPGVVLCPVVYDPCGSLLSQDIV